MFSSWPSYLLSFLPLISLTTALPQPRSTSPSNAVRTIYEFPNETWIENIAIRSNGNLLLTLISTPSLYELNPFDPSSKAQLLHSFPSSTSLLGISEIQPDIFAVIAGNWSTTTFTTTNGSYSVWKVDLNPNAKVKIDKIAEIREASFLNGMTLLAPSSPYLLISDSGLGVVWRLNYLTGEYKIILDSPLMKPVAGQLLLGINGIRILPGTNLIYFTNSFQYLLARVPVYLSGPLAGSASGNYTVVAKTGFADDFTFDSQGNAYVTQDPGDALEVVSQEGEVKVLVGSESSTIVEGDTADAFGRTEEDRGTLYVVTNGGIAGLVNGTRIVGGKVLAVDVEALEARWRGEKKRVWI
jgi:hypothetical protein